MANHVLPVLGDRRIDTIKYNDVVNWLVAQSGLPSSINGRLRILKSVMKEALARHDLHPNPAAGVRCVRRPATSENSRNTLTLEQRDLFLWTARTVQPKWFPVFATLAYTGAHVGEVTALRWEDITLPNDDDPATGGSLRICRSHHRGHVDSTKTGITRRVPLSAPLLKVLLDHHRNRSHWHVRADRIEGAADAIGDDDERLALFRASLEEGWIFPNSRRDTPLITSVLRKPFLGVFDQLERRGRAIERITIHGLRRTMNNLLRQAGVDHNVIRAIMGHVSPRMTEHYSHVTLAERSSAMLLVIGSDMIGQHDKKTLAANTTGLELNLGLRTCRGITTPRNCASLHQ